MESNTILYIIPQNGFFFMNEWLFLKSTFPIPYKKSEEMGQNFISEQTWLWGLRKSNFQTLIHISTAVGWTGQTKILVQSRPSVCLYARLSINHQFTVNTISPERYDLGHSSSEKTLAEMDTQNFWLGSVFVRLFSSFYSNVFFGN